jgi:hypothetical protein
LAPLAFQRGLFCGAPAKNSARRFDIVAHRCFDAFWQGGASMPIHIALAALTATFSVAAFACAAQEPKTTKIHAVFEGYYERIRPGYSAGITTEEITLVLTGRNKITETRFSHNALASKSFESESTLGGKTWRVDGPHRIVGTQPLPQSIRTFTIEVNGATCKASWVNKLLPGFQEYNIYSIVLGQNAFYKQARMVSSTCDIESQ